MIEQTKQWFLFLLLFAFIGLALISCDDDDTDQTGPTPPNATITSLDILLTDTTTKVTDTITYSDPDGVGLNAPLIFDTIRLNRDSVYTAQLRFYNEFESDTTFEVNPEIQANGVNYLICYINNGANGLEIDRTDLDANGQILGFNSLWRSPSVTIPLADASSLKVILRYQPDQKDGSCSQGSTDFEVNFPIEVR